MPGDQESSINNTIIFMKLRGSKDTCVVKNLEAIQYASVLCRTLMNEMHYRDLIKQHSGVLLRSTHAPLYVRSPSTLLSV